MFGLSNTPPRVAIDLDDHRRRTYVALRRAMVIVTGVFLVAVVVHRFVLQMSQENSISAYYYHENNTGLPMRDLFIGSLCAMGLLLIAYQGYRDAENVALNIGGGALICVAMFPMEPPSGEKSWVDKVHYLSAVVFYISLIYVVWFRAHDTLQDISEKRRFTYKTLYRLSGLLMTCVVISSIVFYFVNRADNAAYPMWLLWAEFFGVFAFLLFWSVKTIEIENSKIDQKDQDQMKCAAYPVIPQETL